MKKLLVLIIVCFGFTNCKAQTLSLTRDNFNDIPDNAYIKDMDGKLNAFVGSWTWSNNNEEFTVIFVKKIAYNANGLNKYKLDIVMGGYKYVVNGIIIINTLTFNTNANLNEPSSFNSYAPIITFLSKPYNEMNMQVVDKIKNKACQGSFQLLNPTTNLFGQLNANQANWKIWDNEKSTINGQNAQIQGFSIPTDVTLTKIP